MENLGVLSVDELDSGLADLNSSYRQEAVALVKSWSLYGKKLTEVGTSIAALPDALKRQPLAEELATADRRHDALGAAFHSVCHTHITDPASPADVVVKARTLRDAFVPSLSELAKPYAAEVAAAKAKKAALAIHAADLKLFPLAGQRTLFDVANDFVAAGEAIDTLLTKRSHVQAESKSDDPRLAVRLRTRALSLLARFRRAVGEELELDETLPRDLDGRIFGKLDELARLHAARLAGAPQPPPATPIA